ncbi:MAG: serine hydrolase domain-containing protein [Sphingobium sp.]
MTITLSVSPRFDERRLHHLCDTLEQKYIASGRLPHLQLLISADEQLLVRATMGSGRQDGSPLADNALYRIASMTKPITSVAFLILLERGQIGLDTPVADILPEFAQLNVAAETMSDGSFSLRPPASPMRMIDLLRHTSGLTYSFQQRSAIDQLYAERQLDTFQQKRSSDDYITALAEIPLEFSPGASWNYSVSTDVLGVVIERVSGESLDSFFERHIFGPLMMRDSFFQVPDDRIGRLTDAWMLDDTGEISLYDRGAHSRWRLPQKSWSGGGGLVSTAHDYHRFCQMLLRGGELDGARLLSPKTVALMTANHLPSGADLASISQSMFSESTNEGIGFGLGVAVTVDPARSLLPGSAGEYYWGGLLSTTFFIDPVERIIAILMTQVMPSSAFTIRRELKTLLYSSMIESRA